MEKRCSGKRATLPAGSTLPRVNMRKKLLSFSRVKSWLYNDNSARACSDLLALTELTWLGEPKRLYREKLALAKRVTLLSK